MATITVTSQARVAAPADRVYAILADYVQHHPRILPPAFSDYAVEQGGVGAGTVIRFRLAVAGASREARGAVSEPQPGRVLSEQYEDGTLTSFAIEPDGGETIVRIDTVYPLRGARGLIERLLVPPMLRRMFRDELARLDRYARDEAVLVPQPAG